MLRHLNDLLSANFDNDTILSEDQVTRLMHCIFNRSLHFRDKEQNDAQQFLTFFRQWLEEELKYVASNFQRAGIDMTFIKGDANNVIQFLKSLSVVYTETRTCSQGHMNQVQVNDFLSLPIEFSWRSVNDCLTYYFSNERLKCTCIGRSHSLNNNYCNAYNCGRCGSYVDAVCTKRIVSLPDILIIHLLIFDHVNVINLKLIYPKHAK